LYRGSTHELAIFHEEFKVAFQGACRMRLVEDAIKNEDGNPNVPVD